MLRRLSCFFGFHGHSELQITVGFLETFYARPCPHCGALLPMHRITHDDVDAMTTEDGALALLRRKGWTCIPRVSEPWTHMSHGGGVVLPPRSP